MSNDNIMKGYKGIMDLDLSTIDPKFHDEVRKQHLAEIKEYESISAFIAFQVTLKMQQ